MRPKALDAWRVLPENQRFKDFALLKRLKVCL